MAKKGQQPDVLFDAGWYNNLRYNVVPPLFVLVFTGAVQWLGLLGGVPCPFDLDQCPRLLGNAHSWNLTGLFLLWVFVWLWIPSKKFQGPLSPEGEIPVYQDNGFAFFLASCVLFVALEFLLPNFSSRIVENFPEILSSLNIVALFLCLWLCVSARVIKGKKQKGIPFLYDFYRGCELHPHVFGVDAKQLTISRIGMILWQLLVMAAFFVGPKNAPDIVSLVMQTIYIAKFYWWENGYYTTLDMTYDRAGYYLCWGGTAWMPALFPLSQMYMSENHSTLGVSESIVVLLVGLVATAIEYRIDLEKEVFVAWRQLHAKNKAKPYILWGKKVEYLDVFYTNAKGVKVKSALLTSGFWGKARHFNYTFELICCLTCCVTAGFGQSWFLPLFYFYFIAALIPHRILRDEEKCRNKYGQYWDQYCKKVPYRMIPYVF